MRSKIKLKKHEKKNPDMHGASLSCNLNTFGILAQGRLRQKDFKNSELGEAGVIEQDPVVKMTLCVCGGGKQNKTLQKQTNTPAPTVPQVFPKAIVLDIPHALFGKYKN